MERGLQTPSSSHYSEGTSSHELGNSRGGAAKGPRWEAFVQAQGGALGGAPRRHGPATAIWRASRNAAFSVASRSFYGKKGDIGLHGPLGTH